ncbi:protein FAM81B [Solea solea]|uniref:protein FAM81B n=1 Tax=Solea solea TaxID=90069 RepID=UPI00272A61B5|nr:protein FAM81B [Solea solea]
MKAARDQSRSDVSEAGVGGQQTALAVLLEQAFSIKEEVAAGLQSTRGSVQVEALSRKLLERHILTVTHIVKQLSMEIQAVDRQLVQRDSVTSGTTRAVQSLDQKNTAAIGDLRARVARCDASIVKLSVDVSSGERQMKRLQQEMKDLRAAVDVKIKELEVKLHRDLGGLTTSLTEISKSQRNDVSELKRRDELREDKMWSGLKEVKEQTDSLKKWTEQQLSDSLQNNQRLHENMVEAESRLSGQLFALEVRVDQAERSQADRLKRSENKLGLRMSSVESGLHQELQLLKQEYHKGFQSVYDAIESLRQISDVKSRLDKEKLQNEIRHICSKVADISD